MITTYLRKTLLAVVCLLTGVSAYAQFTGSATQYPTTNYATSPIAFKLSDMATALSTDAATLGASLQAYIEAETPEALFFLPDANGNETSAPSADYNGFWMSATGQRLDYGDGCVFFASPSVDVEADEFAFNVGQMPNVMQAGDEAHAAIKLKYNSQEITFNITLSVIAKPVYDVPEPTLKEADLTIVGEKEVVVEQFPRGDYSRDPVSIELTDVAALLGIADAGLLVDALDKVLYTTQYNAGDVEQGGGMKKDSLTNQPTGEGIGYWFRPVQDANGEENGEVSAAGWGDVDKFFINHFTFNAETNTLSGVLGQYPGSCKENEEWYAYIYLIYGNKAFRVKVTLKVLEQEQGSGLSNYTKVGEETVVVEQEPRDDYSASAVHPDMDAIAAALGCEVSAVGMTALDDKDNFASSTANNGGYWFSDAGTVVAWGNGAMYVEPATANDYSTLNVGQRPERNYQVGEEGSSYLYFTNGTNYYAYTVTLKIVEPQKVEHNFESVATRTFALQSLLDNNYTAMDLATVKTEDIEAAIGTATPTLYGLNPDSVAAVTGSQYSNKYSCDPKPGFWLAKDGNVSVWGAESPVGISWVDNTTLRFFQYPNANAVGDVFTTQLFLVNEETEKMITLNISLTFVETLEEKEIVGSENILIPMSTSEIEVHVDLTKPAEALGVTVSDLLNSNNYYLRGLTAAGVYGETNSCANGLSFAVDGGYDSYGDLFFTITESGDQTVIQSFSNNKLADDYSVDAQFCFEVENKQYVYYAKLMSQTAYENGIESVTADRNTATIFDLSGRRVAQPTRGLYIQKGRKFVVK